MPQKKPNDTHSVVATAFNISRDFLLLFEKPFKYAAIIFHVFMSYTLNYLYEQKSEKNISFKKNFMYLFITNPIKTQ